jgi:hypothetical protein
MQADGRGHATTPSIPGPWLTLHCGRHNLSITAGRRIIGTLYIQTDTCIGTLRQPNRYRTPPSPCRRLIRHVCCICPIVRRLPRSPVVGESDRDNTQRLKCLPVGWVRTAAAALAAATLVVAATAVSGCGGRWLLGRPADRPRWSGARSGPRLPRWRRRDGCRVDLLRGAPQVATAENAAPVATGPCVPRAPR